MGRPLVLEAEGPPAAAALPQPPALLFSVLSACRSLSRVHRHAHRLLPRRGLGSCQPLTVSCAFCQPRQ